MMLNISGVFKTPGYSFQNVFFSICLYSDNEHCTSNKNKKSNKFANRVLQIK